MERGAGMLGERCRERKFNNGIMPPASGRIQILKIK
jgi:hypothetical protein